MKKVAFITCKDLPQCTADDLLTKQDLVQQGMTMTPVIWDEVSVLELNRYAAVLIRSPWDYQHKQQDFRKFLVSLNSLQMPVLNTPELMLWNMDKSYLLELSEKGISIPPSKKISKGLSSEQWLEYLESCPWENIVIKPTISASAFNTYFIDKEDAIKRVRQWEGLSVQQDFLIQKFCPEIQNEGEISLVFFNSPQGTRYSHAVQKKPKDGDFRVQKHLGGTTSAYKAGGEAIHFGEQVLATLKQPWLYARVDILKVDGNWSLGELEVLEPMLFFGYEPKSTKLFAETLKAFI